MDDLKFYDRLCSQRPIVDLRGPGAKLRIVVEEGVVMVPAFVAFDGG